MGSASPQPMVDPDELRRHRRALRILVVVLIPLAIWTVVGMVALWPGDVSSHVNPEVAGYNIEGVTYPSARITSIAQISCDGLSGSTPGVADNRCANATAELLDGDDAGQSVTVPLTDAIFSSGVEVGQVIKLIRVPPADDRPAEYQFSDFERSTPLIVFTALFAVAVIAVARWRGFASLIGLTFAGFVLVKFMFPALISGSNPIMVGLIGSSAIMFVVLYAAHGFSARTSTALVGTLFGLILIAALGWVATEWAHLTGVAAEDDYVLAAAAPDLTLRSVVICAIIVAGLGVLNDVTITQASAVWELADQGQSQRRLFSRAMRIGRDHIASTVYTIAFATAGATLSVLLLLSIYDRPLLEVVQTEQFSQEIIRTLVGSIGLILAVPLTTAVGVAVVRASGSGSATGPRIHPARTLPAAGRPDREPTTGRKRPDRPVPPARDEEPDLGPPEAETGVLPATKWRDFGERPSAPPATPAPSPAPSRSAKSPTPAEQSRRRRSRRHDEDDDFGDFTYLRDPGDTDPGPGGGRRGP
jgi:uncharacterized membrane protein